MHEQIARAKEIQPYIEDIFGTSGAADCEALVNIFTPQFKEKSNDVEFIKNMLRRLGRANCKESELFAQATEKLYELEPSAEAAFNMARRYLQRDNAEKAKEYYKQAMDQETDKELAGHLLLRICIFYFCKRKCIIRSTELLRKALAINPDYCEAMELIG